MYIVPALPIPLLSEKDVVRFWSHITKSDSCWNWHSHTVKGYGQFTMVENGPGRGCKNRAQGTKLTLLAHRVAYSISNGECPTDKLVCHKCDNPLCCRPDHLFLGTPQDNHDDCNAKKRRPFGEKNGMYTHPECTSGEANGRAILTNEDVLYLRSRKFTTKEREEYALSKDINYSTVANAIRRVTWKHI